MRPAEVDHLIGDAAQGARRPRLGAEGRLRGAGADDGRGRPGRAAAARRPMTRAFVTGISGQDGCYLAERLLAEGVEVHALAHRAEPTARTARASSSTSATSPTSTRSARLLLDLAPDEIYNLAAVSSVARSWAEPDLTARVNGMAAVVAHGVRAAAPGEARTGRPSGAGLQRRDLRPAERHAPGRGHPVRPVNPYGAAKAYAHLMVDVYRHRDLHAVSAILYNHESPRRPAQFVTRKITSTVAAIAQGRAERLDARATWTPGGTGAGRPTTSTRWCARRAPTTARRLRGRHRRRPLGARLRRRGVPPRRDRRLVERSSTSTPSSSARPTPATSPATPAAPGRELGWAPTVGFEELVGRMVDADLGLTEVVSESSSRSSR